MIRGEKRIYYVLWNELLSNRIRARIVARMMKWKFLVIALVAVFQGGLLSWDMYEDWQGYQSMINSGDGDSIICKISYDAGWPRPLNIALSLGIFAYSLHHFFRLNADVPITRRRLKILTRP